MKGVVGGLGTMVLMLAVAIGFLLGQGKTAIALSLVAVLGGLCVTMIALLKVREKGGE